MRREDGNSYTTLEEAVEIVNDNVAFSKQRGILIQGFVQQRGANNFLVTPIEYRSFKTLYATLKD